MRLFWPSVVVRNSDHQGVGQVGQGAKVNLGELPLIIMP